MAEANPLPAPAPTGWIWGPERKGFGGYCGTCTIGPFTFTISVRQRFDNGWELHATATLAAVTMASHSWEADTLSCTPDGIIAEVAKRDVLSQLTETTRRQVAEAARLLEEFDVISRACSQHDEAGPQPT